MNKQQVIIINENQLKQIVMESVRRLINENSVSKEGYPRRVFHLGEKLGNWELVKKDGLDYCILRPISKNHIMKDGWHWNSTIVSIPADMFDKSRSELEKYVADVIIDDYNKTQDFYKNWKPSEIDDEEDDDRTDYMLCHPSIYKPSDYN